MNIEPNVTKSAGNSSSNSSCQSVSLSLSSLITRWSSSSGNDTMYPSLCPLDTGRKLNVRKMSYKPYEDLMHV